MTNPPASGLCFDNHRGSLPSYPSPPLFLDPLLGERDRSPAIGLTLFVQAAQPGKQQMWRRDQDVLAREPGQQSIPCHRSCGGVGVEDRRDLGMLQLDALRMDDVAPEQ